MADTEGGSGEKKSFPEQRAHTVADFYLPLQKTVTVAEKALSRATLLKEEGLRDELLYIIKEVNSILDLVEALSGSEGSIFQRNEIEADISPKINTGNLKSLTPESSTEKKWIPEEYPIWKLNSFDQDFLDKARNFILAHLNETEFGAKELSQYLGLSKTQMHRKITALAGLSPGRFVYHVRLKEARKLLTGTNLTISEIAYSTGFSDPGYFTRLFTKEFGNTPSYFRKQVRDGGDNTSW